ncbi:hypothetical protein OAA91_00895 [Fibrobacterales bacterium]|nr:hypothetical protein [Fibrobacterales bacterium]
MFSISILGMSMGFIKRLELLKISFFTTLIVGVCSGFSFSQTMQVWNDDVSLDYSVKIEVDSVTFVWGGYDTLKIWNGNYFTAFVVQSEVDSVTFLESCSNIYNDSSFFDCRDGQE